MKRKLIRIMYVVTPVMLVLLLALNVFTILKVKALEESAGGDETEDVAQENDVTIGGEYVIKATTQISDAYDSGSFSACIFCVIEQVYENAGQQRGGDLFCFHIIASLFSIKQRVKLTGHNRREAAAYLFLVPVPPA